MATSTRSTPGSEPDVDAATVTAAVARPIASGLYRWSPTPYSTRGEELRLDVDGPFPQHVASGVIRASATSVLDWVANLVLDGADAWSGTIWYKHGSASLLPHGQVSIQVARNATASQQTATMTFTGGGAARSRVLKYRSRYFHPVHFEFDVAEGEAATLSMQTCAHPNRPATLPCETLTIQTVFRRAGFDVTTGTPGIPVPLAGAGVDALWSDDEMHDAMQAYWAKFSSSAKWALWTFFASLHETDVNDPDDVPENLGGIMFDTIGSNHRQGTAIFVDAFISDPPAGDPNPAAWVRRMIFWCACHEMGHAFNLAHSWDKPEGSAWIDIPDESEARSFMNYPYNVAGGEPAFFDDFEYRFSDSELLFMRHAPAQFVQMGNADWFDNHGFEHAAVSPAPTFTLGLRANRDQPQFEFMEPVVLELKLANVSRQPALVDRYILLPDAGMTVIIKKQGKEARRFIPYARYCRRPATRVIDPGKAVYESLFLSAGLNGWDIAEPGIYTVQVAIRIGEEDVLSNALRVRVAPPRGYDEEYLAQDFFSDDVGRIVAFDGSRYLESGNDVLREVTGKLRNRRVALHASVALGKGLARDSKQLVDDRKDPRKRIGIKVEKAQPRESEKLLASALCDHAGDAIESLGHIDYKWYADFFAEWLAKRGERAQAYKAQDVLLKTIASRTVRGRKVLDGVVAETKAKRDSYRGRKG